MTPAMLFFVTTWTAIGALLGYAVMGLLELTDRWREERRHL